METGFQISVYVYDFNILICMILITTLDTGRAFTFLLTSFVFPQPPPQLSIVFKLARCLQ